MIYRYSFRVDGGSDWNRTVYSEFQGIEDISKIYIYSNASNSTEIMRKTRYRVPFCRFSLPFSYGRLIASVYLWKSSLPSTYVYVRRSSLHLSLVILQLFMVRINYHNPVAFPTTNTSRVDLTHQSV